MIGNIMTVDRFAAYRRHCREKGYCEPWVPFVGKNYLTTDGVRLVYAGAAPWFDTAPSLPENDDEALKLACSHWDDFAGDGGYGSPFWRLLDRVRRCLSGVDGTAPGMQQLAWTNLSKAGVVGDSAPPVRDRVLRELDVLQFQHELGILTPDLLVCVSGSLLEPTGMAVFGTREWTPTDLSPVSRKSWIRRSPWGGWLLWTMHPSFKPTAWFDAVAQDVAAIVARIGANNA